MELLLVRHGQSGNNLIWERTGSSRGRSPDPALSDLGRGQADAVAAALAGGGYDARPTHVYTSLMLRAVQTAAPIAEALELPLVGHPEAFEVYGPVVYDGAAGVEYAQARPFPGACRADLVRVSERLVWPDGVSCEAGWWSGPVERIEDVPGRASRVLAGLVAAHGATDDVLALVSHGTFGHYLLREVLGIEGMRGWIELENTSVSHFRDVAPPEGADPRGAVPRAVAINRVDHLVGDTGSGLRRST